MDDFIKREEAINEQKRFCGYLDNDMLNRLEIATRRIPAADVRPVVRGKWHAVKGALHPAETSAVCSNCGFATMIHAQTFYNFCPSCGADMREES